MKLLSFLLCLSLLFISLPGLAEDDVTGIWYSRLIYMEGSWIPSSMTSFRDSFELKPDGTFLDPEMDIKGTWSYDQVGHIISVTDEEGDIVRLLATLEDGCAYETYEDLMFLYRRGPVPMTKPRQAAARSIDDFAGNWTAAYHSTGDFFETLDDMEFLGLVTFSSAIIEGEFLSVLLVQDDHLIQYESSIKMQNNKLVISGAPELKTWYDGIFTDSSDISSLITIDSITLAESDMICISFVLKTDKDTRLDLYYTRSE